MTASLLSSPLLPLSLLLLPVKHLISGLSQQQQQRPHSSNFFVCTKSHLPTTRQAQATSTTRSSAYMHTRIRTHTRSLAGWLAGCLFLLIHYRNITRGPKITHSMTEKKNRKGPRSGCFPKKPPPDGEHPSKHASSVAPRKTQRKLQRQKKTINGQRGMKSPV